MSRRKSGKYIFRGTTIGWKGNPVNIALPITPTTTNPIKAILFAQCCEYKNQPAVIYFSHTNNLKGVKREKNVLAGVEDEIGFEITPSDFVKRSYGYIFVNEAEKIINDLGFVIPPLIDRSLVRLSLEETHNLNDDDIRHFYEIAHSILKKT